MVQIKAVLLNRMRNETNYQFLQVYENLVIAHPPVRALIEEKFQAFMLLHYQEKSLLDIQRGSPLTEHIEETDHRLDNFVVGLNSTINTNLHHYLPANIEAARVLEMRMKAFGDIGHKNYEDESSAIQVLTADLMSTFKDQVALLDLGAWISEMMLVEQEFTDLLAQRNASSVASNLGNMVDVRKALGISYKGMTSVIDADVIMNGEGKCGQFIALLNNEIDNYNEKVHRVRHDIKNVTASSIPDQTYTGKVIIPIPQVFYTEAGRPTKELVFSVDFMVTYRNNIEAGTAEVILHGKGNYKGRKIITFNIARTL